MVLNMYNSETRSIIPFVKPIDSKLFNLKSPVVALKTKILLVLKFDDTKNIIIVQDEGAKSM